MFQQKLIPMKKIYLFIGSLMLALCMQAQVPEKISYQAVIRNDEGSLIKNQAISMQISFLQGSVEGDAVYTETHTATTNSNGLVSIEIGTGSTSDDFMAIDWQNGPFFVKTETDPDGGNNYTITGISQLLSVPYALHAKTAEKVTDPSLKLAAAITEADTAKWNEAYNKGLVRNLIQARLQN